MDDVLAGVLPHLNAADPGGGVGLYLYGSAVEQLQAESDIDLLLEAPRVREVLERLAARATDLAYGSDPPSGVGESPQRNGEAS